MPCVRSLLNNRSKHTRTHTSSLRNTRVLHRLCKIRKIPECLKVIGAFALGIFGSNALCACVYRAFFCELRGRVYAAFYFRSVARHCSQSCVEYSRRACWESVFSPTSCRYVHKREREKRKERRREKGRREGRCISVASLLVLTELRMHFYKPVQADIHTSYTLLDPYLYLMLIISPQRRIVGTLYDRKRENASKEAIKKEILEWQ